MKEKIMVPLLILFGLVMPLAAQELPGRPATPIADFAQMIDQRDESELTMLAQALWEQAQFALVVATVPDLAGMDINDYANRLYEKWGIGRKGADEGALVLISRNPRKVRIEVGYGAEGYLSDALSGRILNTYGIPYFQRNQFSAGLKSMSLAIAQTVQKEKQVSLTAPVRRRSTMPRRKTSTAGSVFRLIFFVIVAAFLIGTPFGRMLLFSMVLSSLLGGGRRGFGGGGFGGGFGGGGFGGGFGGGMSGGGGAGGSY